MNANTAGVEIHASRSAIDQVIDILISNSLDHGQGATRISSRLVAGGIAIDVTDDGSGIESSSAEAVFERGYGKGNGIGLALARTLAEADGGRLILMNHQPPRFTLLFSTTDEPNRARLRSEAAVGARD